MYIRIYTTKMSELLFVKHIRDNISRYASVIKNFAYSHRFIGGKYIHCNDEISGPRCFEFTLIYSSTSEYNRVVLRTSLQEIIPSNIEVRLWGKGKLSIFALLVHEHTEIYELLTMMTTRQNN